MSMKSYFQRKITYALLDIRRQLIKMTGAGTCRCRRGDIVILHRTTPRVFINGTSCSHMFIFVRATPRKTLYAASPFKEIRAMLKATRC